MDMELRTTLVQTKGKWYVSATVPTHLRQLFNGQKQIKLSTGTSDRAIAEKRQVSKSNEIYQKIYHKQNSDHPVIAAIEKVLDATSEVKANYDVSEVLVEEKRPLIIADIFKRSAYAEFKGRTIECELERERYQSVLENINGAFDEIYGHVEFLRHPSVDEPNDNNLPCILEVLERWQSETHFNRLKTKNTYVSHVKRFVKHNGNLKLSEITKVVAYKYVRHLENEGLAHSTIETSVASMRGLFKFAEEHGLAEKNVFSEVNLKGKGKPKQKRVPFTKHQLIKLFQLDMNERDRLCLKILSTTGMRLDEVALLRFEDIKLDKDTGLRYLDLTSEDKILKNDRASRRIIPIPDVLDLPLTGNGRIFDYPTDKDGKSQNAASKALLRKIELVREEKNQNLVVHILRHTYKDMLRDAGIPKDMHDFLLGHSASSVGESYGQGYSLRAKYEAIQKLDFSFLC